MEITIERLRELIDTLRSGQVSDFEYEDEKLRLKFAFGMSRAPSVASTPSATPLEVVSPAVEAPKKVDAANDDQCVYVTSPFVGTFYRSTSPESAPFAEVGAAVNRGQTLCIVEAMKLMNEIESDVTGILLDALVDNGVSVEFGQRLFKIRKG